MWAVLWTDLVQFVIKMSAVIILAVFAVKAVGGMDAMKAGLVQHFGSEKAALSVLPVGLSPDGLVAYAWMPLLERIPEPQRDALAVALMLRDGPTPERFAVCVGALSLISRFAEEWPLLVLVDDAHLVDAPSAEALVFIARRLVAPDPSPW